ncbi:MAG: PfkB family carbohydrate kinase [Bryobacteraceae bacterium]|jgi:rfaE bifunctional protein kinase chain/domain
MTTAETLAAIRKIAALVVGDICLDRWCTYDPGLSEPSRETGIPTLGVMGSYVSPGAGGTVANNLASLNAYRIAVLGVLGDDGNGFELERALQARGVSLDLMIKDPQLPTFTYNKLFNSETGVEDRPRVDFIPFRPLPPGVERKVMQRLESAIGGFDVVIASDHAKTEHGGVITPGVRSLLRTLAQRYPDKVIWVHSRRRSHLFRGVIVKPNRQEADEASLRLFHTVDYERLRNHLETNLMIVTRGSDGALVVEPGRATAVMTVPVANPIYPCGAADSFSAGAALALAATGSPVEAARFGNLVSSVTIMKEGTGTASPEEVLAAEAALWK